MAEAKFQKVYEAKILEFKDTFEAIKSWKSKFSSTKELELELNRFKQTFTSPPVITEVKMLGSIQTELAEQEAELRQLDFHHYYANLIG